MNTCHSIMSYIFLCKGTVSLLEVFPHRFSFQAKILPNADISFHRYFCIAPPSKWGKVGNILALAILTPQNHYYGWWWYYFYRTILILCLAIWCEQKLQGSNQWHYHQKYNKNLHHWSPTLFPMYLFTYLWDNRSQAREKMRWDQKISSNISFKPFSY